jgi:3-phenylpropionate/trans-cinnamate dioxygenase ferredoxin subunit
MERFRRNDAAPAPSEGFVRVARVTDIPPGSLLRVDVDMELICLANVGGHIYAISDDCPHIGGALSDGDLAGCVVTCPVHLAQFDVRSGRVLRGPAREDVPTYEVRVEGDDVYVAVRR